MGLGGDRAAIGRRYGGVCTARAHVARRISALNPLLRVTLPAFLGDGRVTPFLFYPSFYLFLFLGRGVG